MNRLRPPVIVLGGDVFFGPNVLNIGRGSQRQQRRTTHVVIQQPTIVGAGRTFRKELSQFSPQGSRERQRRRKATHISIQPPAVVGAGITFRKEIARFVLQGTRDFQRRRRATSFFIQPPTIIVELLSGPLTGLAVVNVFDTSTAWTKPDGALFVEVVCIGAGGGGGAGASAIGTGFGGGGGAGGGAVAVAQFLASELHDSETIVVGASGAGAIAGVSAATDGGATSFGSWLSAQGGKLGNGGNSTFVQCTGGHGGGVVAGLTVQQNGLGAQPGTGAGTGGVSNAGTAEWGGGGGAGQVNGGGSSAGGSSIFGGPAGGRGGHHSGGSATTGTGGGATQSYVPGGGASAGGVGVAGSAGVFTGPFCGQGGGGGGAALSGSAGNGGNGSIGAGGGGGGAVGIGGTRGRGGNGGPGRIIVVSWVYATRHTLPPIGSTTTFYGIRLTGTITVPFLASTTTFYTPGLVTHIDIPFIASTTQVFPPAQLYMAVVVPFLASNTTVFDLFSIFNDDEGWGAGTGNGGETFSLVLNANGVTTNASLSSGISSSDELVTLVGAGGLPATRAFVALVDSEIMMLQRTGGSDFRIRARALSNTVAAAHTGGATLSWGDTYDMAVVAEANADASFVDVVDSELHYGWLIAFDSSQAYLGTARYPMHVTEVVGVFPAGTGVGGSNRLDASQPNSICVPTGVSDDCPAALSVPARISTDIGIGDVAIARYTNPEASVLTLGPRSVAMQTWYGLKRVDATDNDVTLSDPNGFIVDGSVHDEFLNPVGNFTTVTLDGSDRTFTHGGAPSPPNYNERGWPICCLAVRNGQRRVPYWESPDWHNFNFVYSGFFTDATYAQVVINRNGIVYGSPTVSLPGPQDIDGPNATWDDGSYYFGVSWYVVLYETTYVFLGPILNSGSPQPGPPNNPVIPTVTFPSPGGPTESYPPFSEGGSGGNIPPPNPLGRSSFDGLVVQGKSGV